MKPRFGHRSNTLHKAWKFLEFGVYERFREVIGFDKMHIMTSNPYPWRRKSRPYFAYERRKDDHTGVMWPL